MKTKSLILAGLLTMSAGTLAAQQQSADTLKRASIITQGDSIIIQKGSGDMRIKVYENLSEDEHGKTVEIYEGVYLEKVDADQRNFLDALPFVPKKRKNIFMEHYPLLYFMFDKLSSHNLRYSSPYPARNGKSWEWGINIASHAFILDSNKHWGITTAFGFAYTKYHFEGNYTFRKIGENTVFTPDTEEREYKKSLLRYWSLRAPVSLEWQTKAGHANLYLSAGAELEWRFSMKSKAKYEGETHTVGKNLNYNPIGANLLLQVGYDDFMLIARFGLTPLMSKSHAPEMYHSSIGIGLSM